MSRWLIDAWRRLRGQPVQIYRVADAMARLRQERDRALYEAERLGQLRPGDPLTRMLRGDYGPSRREPDGGKT